MNYEYCTCDEHANIRNSDCPEISRIDRMNHSESWSIADQNSDQHSIKKAPHKYHPENVPRSWSFLPKCHA